MPVWTLGIIGCGQLGSRHLQAMAATATPEGTTLQLEIVEPWEGSRETAKARLAEVNAERQVPANFHGAISDLPAALDLVVVATTADVRRKVVEELLAHSAVRFLVLEKVLFQAEADYAAIADLMAQKNTVAWVNCPRRMFAGYNTLRDMARAKASTPLSMTVDGAGWGLACNAVHFIDLLTWLNASDGVFAEAEVAVDAAGLEKGAVEAKRRGAYELHGSVTGSANGGAFSLSCAQSDAVKVGLVLEGATLKITIPSEGGAMQIAEKNAAGEWDAAPELPVGLRYQSQLTGDVCGAILSTGGCQLTPYAQSSAIHLPVIGEFTKHFQLAGIAGCPIT